MLSLLEAEIERNVTVSQVNVKTCKSNFSFIHWSLFSHIQ